MLLATLAALALAACGGGEPAQEDDVTGATPAAGAGADAGEEAQPDEEEAADHAPAGTMTSEDGWNGLHDLDVPEAGTASIAVDGAEMDLEVSCTRPGPLEDHGYLLFGFSFEGVGESSDGRRITVTGSREIVTEQEAAASGNVYEYQGQERGSLQITAFDGERNQIAIAMSPADDDPAGEQLPILRVDDTGAFTADQPVPAFAMFHDEAVDGHVVLAGRCQEGWPDDVR